MSLKQFCLMCAACSLLVLLGCGPGGIFLKNGLDTPLQHVENGNRFMNHGKFDAAFEEFQRAVELDPALSPAYVGLGLAAGYRGDPEKGLEIMEKARELARNGDQRKNADAGYEILQEMAGTKE